MKKCMRNVAGALGLAVIGSTPAFAQQSGSWMGGRLDTGLYLGAGVGQSKSKIDTAGFAGEVDDTDTTWKVFAGYRFSRHIALEGSYHDLGKVSFSGRLTAAAPPFPVGTATSGTFKSKAYALSLIATLPLPHNFAVFGRVGVAYGEQEGDVTVGGLTASASDESTEATYGLGLHYDFTRNLGLLAQWQRFRVGGASVGGKNDVDSYTVDLVFRFE